jgi:hypothetical protein
VAGEDEPDAGQLAFVEPCQSGQEPLNRGIGTAAHAQVRPVEAEGEAERAGRGMQGKMGDQVGRDAPDAFFPEPVEGHDELRPAEES